MKEKECIPHEIKILCPYCRAVWTAKMLEELEASKGCDTCGLGEGIILGSISIICSNCEKVVYVKYL
jgi:hypothetical protein